MTKQATIDLLQQQLPGYYSVEQVIEMISKIEQPQAISEDLLDKIIKTAKRAVESGMEKIEWTDCNYELSMGGGGNHWVTLDSIEVDSAPVEDRVERALRNLFEEEFGA